MKSLIIAPSIVSADHLRLQEEIATCEEAGADWLHVDVMDGHFVPNITMGPFLVKTYRRASKLPLDVHLMIEEPEKYLEAFARAGATRMTVHLEACAHIHRTMQQIKDLGCEAGVTLNPGTAVSELVPVIPIADLVLVLSVDPGFSYQSFIPESIGRITEARRMLDDLKSKAHLEVDGGVSIENISRIVAAGATAFVSANAIFSHPEGTAAGLKSLREAAASGQGRSRPA